MVTKGKMRYTLYTLGWIKHKVKKLFYGFQKKDSGASGRMLKRGKVKKFLFSRMTDG